MLARPIAVAVLLVLVLTAAPARGAAARDTVMPPPPDPTLSVAERAQAEAEISKRIVGCDNHEVCATRIVQIALFDAAPGSVLQRHGFERIRENLMDSKNALFEAFGRGTPVVQAQVLTLLDEGWDTLVRSTDYQFTNLAATALESPSPDVRRAAGRLMAHRPLPQIAHWAVDAAVDDPPMTLAALMAVELTRSPYVCRWVIEQLVSKNPDVRQQALRTISAIGRAAVPFLRERTDDPDKAVRGAVIRAWLLVALGDDQPQFETWQTTHGKDDVAVAQQVTTALAQLQAGKYAPAMPARPELSFR